MSTLAAYRRLLSNGALSRLFFGEFVSSIGDWLYLVALLVVVYQETGDPVLLGVVGAARVLPYVLLSVPAGIIADRYDRRLVLISTDLARGAIMVVLTLIVAFDGPLWAIVGLSILATCFSCFFGPTIGAYLPLMVRGEDELGPANSAWATLDNLAFVVGPAIAGILIATSGLTLAFALNAVSFGVVAIVLWGLPSRVLPEDEAVARPATTGDGVVGEPVETAPTAESALRLEPLKAPVLAPRAAIRPIVGLGTLDVVSGFVFGGLGVLTVLLATDRLHAGDEATGYLNAAIGVGGMVGAIASGALVLRPSLRVPLIIGAVLLAAGLAGLGLFDALAGALVAMTIASAGSLVSEVVSTTIFQRVVPDEIRGRALGTMATFSTLAYAAGSLLLPILATSLGYLPVFVASGIAVLAAAGAALALVGGGGLRAADPVVETLRRVSSLPLFTGVPPSALEKVAGRLRPVSVAAGTVVVREGEPADRFYVIESGSFVVDQGSGDATRRLRTMGPDEVFGELGLLRRAPRSATVTADTDGRLLAIEGTDFLELVSAGPGLASRLLDPRRVGMATSVPGELVMEEAAAG